MNSTEMDELRYYSRELIRELGFLDNPYQDMDLNFAQIHLLLECERYGSIDQQTLSKNLRVNKSYVSRLVKILIGKDLITLAEQIGDGRGKPLMLTALGHQRVQEINAIAKTQVLSALSFLSAQEQLTVKEGLQCYSQALKKARQVEGIVIRPIEQKDDLPLNVLIKSVLIEFGANKPGFAFADEEMNAMYESYQGQGYGYFVAEQSSSLIGGIGFGSLKGADSTVCELRKMYLVKKARGLGLGDELLSVAEKEAKKKYTSMYLETLSSMTQAIALYRRHGFEFLSAPLGDTGHFNCDTWMVKTFY